MSAASPVRVVLFDLGGTLVRVHPSVGEIYAQRGALHGVKITPAEIATNFEAAWAKSLERSAQRGHRCSDAIVKREWREIVRHAFGSAATPGQFDRLFEDLYAYFASARAWVLAPGARECLERLRSLGLRLGILSNWDSRSHSTLQDLELLDAFDEVIVSYAVGFEKPHPEMFRAALRRFAVESAETLLVGDSLPADIEPARRLGFRTLWLAPDDVRRQRPEAGVGSGSLTDLSPEQGWKGNRARLCFIAILPHYQPPPIRLGESPPATVYSLAAGVAKTS